MAQSNALAFLSKRTLNISFPGGEYATNLFKLFNHCQRQNTESRRQQLLKPVHTGNKSCRKRRQIVARNGNKRQQMLPNVAENGNKSRCFRQHLLPFLATFVVVFGDYSFGYNLSPFSATFVASVDRLLQLFFDGHEFGGMAHLDTPLHTNTSVNIYRDRRQRKRSKIHMYSNSVK